MYWLHNRLVYCLTHCCSGFLLSFVMSTLSLPVSVWLTLLRGFLLSPGMFTISTSVFTSLNFHLSLADMFREFLAVSIYYVNLDSNTHLSHPSKLFGQFCTGCSSFSVGMWAGQHWHMHNESLCPITEEGLILLSEECQTADLILAVTNNLKQSEPF